MSKRSPKVSIVIPLYKDNLKFRKCISECKKLDYRNYEIIVVVDDNEVNFTSEGVKVIKTRMDNSGPAEKRDLAISESRAEYIAFIDDDSYPAPDWLKLAVKTVREKGGSVICGPGLTPPDSSLSEIISGSVLTSVFGSGIYTYRFRKDPERLVDDYPAYNMMVERKVLEKVGRFGTKYYGGEDTALCLKLIKAGYKILYIPDMVVYHYRRRFPVQFMKQIGNVGKHRGYFVKKYPETSLRLVYFLPLIFIWGSIVVVTFYFLSEYLTISNWLISSYFILIFLDSVRRNSVFISIFLPFAIYLTHISYGISFIIGLFTKDLRR